MQNQDRADDIADLKAQVRADKTAKRNAALDPRDPEYVDDGGEDSSAQRRATNGRGWEVQQHSVPAGWVAVSEARSTFNEARADMLRMEPVDGVELRVYEALGVAA